MKFKNMIRAGLSTLLMVTLLLCTVACNETPPVTEDNEENESIFAIEYRDVTIALGANAGSILDTLGEPKSSQFVASCGEGAGDQWMYDYSSIILYTVKDGDKETVDAVALRDDSAETVDGLSIGSSEGDMTKAYGNPSENGSKRRYSEGDYTLEFQVDANEKIIAVELRIES